MIKRLVNAVLLPGILFGLVSTSHAVSLDVASEYNAFIFGEMTIRFSNSGGPVAVGGNFTSTNFTVGGSGPVKQYRLVSGGNVDYQTASMSGGGIFAEGDIFLDHHSIFGDVTANGTITVGGGTITGTRTSSAGATSPVNFTDAQSYLLGVSSDLQLKPANALTKVINSWPSGPQIFLYSVPWATVNYFDVDGDVLSNADIFNISLGTDQVAIINVSGSVIDFGGFGATGWENKQQNIIFHFYEATSLTIHNMTVRGNVLAPFADTTFYSAQVYGVLISNTLNWENDGGSPGGTFYYFPFNNDQDNDGILDVDDNCPAVGNPKQYDLDGDGIGLMCDNVDDQDNDGIPDADDNCPAVENPHQYDLDGDGIGLMCDNVDDQDNDGIVDDDDNCPDVANPKQYDLDGDGIGIVCDNPDPDQDNDGIVDGDDNCPDVANPKQYDLDHDGIGVACDGDTIDDQTTINRSLYFEAQAMAARTRAIVFEAKAIAARERYIAFEARAMGDRERYIALEEMAMAALQ